MLFHIRTRSASEGLRQRAGAAATCFGSFNTKHRQAFLSGTAGATGIALITGTKYQYYMEV